MPDYWIDRHEVTNREFKRFVDDGGYRRAELWREPFQKDGRALTFDAAMSLFRDATGRPGPATWEMGSSVAGQDDYPVAGVSWYEAAAYARWAGKSLPTIYHWSRAADQRLSGDVVPASNFSGKSLLPVGASRRYHPRRHDRYGRQRQRVVPECDRREPLHPGWRVERTRLHVQRPGRAVAVRAEPDSWIPLHQSGSAGGSVSLADSRHRVFSRDPRKATPVSEPVFQSWRSLLYSFDHGDPNVKVESVDDSSREWRLERVSYAAAYGGERVAAYLFLPKNGKPPYQVVVVFPGANAVYQRSSASVAATLTGSVSSYGAAARCCTPSTRARSSVATPSRTNPNMTASYRDHMVMWAKDVGRSVDYLERRPDIAKDRIGYFGYSWGAEVAPLFLAVEPRISLGPDLSRLVQPAAVAARSGSREFRTAREGAGVDAQRPLRFLGPNRNLSGAAVQAPRHPFRTQTPCRLRDVTLDPSQRDDQGSRGLDGQVLGNSDALERFHVPEIAGVGRHHWSAWLSR